MKRLALILLLQCILIYAQVDVDSALNNSRMSFNVTKDSLQGDSIDVKSLVEQQILAAKIKMGNESKSENQINDPYKLNVSNVPDYKPKKTLLQLFLNLSFEVKIFLIFSVLLFSLVAVRRLVLRIQKKEGMILRNKIKMLREEKIPDRVYDKKTKTRRELIHKIPVKKISEKHITKKAKELKISKGEILLAARLKYLEYEKM